MKLLRILLIISEVLLLLLLVNPPFVESHSFAGAIAAYHSHPTPQNKTELDREREIVGNRRFRQSTLIAALLAVNTVGLYYAGRRS